MGGFRERVARKVAVIGSGSWGTAATGLVGVHADEVVLWSFEPVVADGINETRHNPHQLTSYEVMPCVRATTSLAEAVGGADAILLVVPSAHLRRICEQLSPYVDSTTPVLVLTKGVERDTGCLMVDVVEQTLGGASRIAALSGPNHAEEISEGTISAAVVAAEDPEVARYFQQLVVSTAFRTYVSEDVRGVEV
jgi:glycerol-3-phosphate dehydrogenase (NAD(P)+)